MTDQVLIQNVPNEKANSQLSLEHQFLDKLDLLLHNKIPEAGIQTLPGNYVFIEEVLRLPQFKEFGLTVENVVHAVLHDGQFRFSVRGSKVRLKPPELNKDRNVIISKKLAWLLRHAAEEEGMQFEDGGYIYMDDMLRHPQFKGISEDEITAVVECNDKRRFEIRENPTDKRHQIRALQGHSVQVEGMDHKLILDAKEFPMCIHGTYFKNWSQIQYTGLKRMGRTHIHMASGEPGEDGVISGMRSSAEIIIFVNIERAMADGIKFYVSQNHVILTEGDDTGTLLPKYFSEVWQRRPRQRLEFTPPP